MNDLNQQLKNVCDKRQNEYNEAAVAELERVKALLPRATVLVGMANELHRRGLHHGKRLSLWFRFTHYYPVTAYPEYEFEVNGKHGIGFEHRYQVSFGNAGRCSKPCCVYGTRYGHSVCV